MEDAELVRLLDDARTARSHAQRAGARALTQAAADAATVAGVLLDLAESGAHVAIGTTGGTTVRGHVAGVGHDFVAVDDHLVALAAVTVIRPEPGTAPAAGDRAGLGVGLASILADWAVSGPAVAVVLVGGERVTGELLSAGVDVLALGSSRGRVSAYVELSSLAEVFRSG